MPSERDVLVIPLGDTARFAERMVADRFGGARRTWLDRNRLRRSPIGTVAGLLLRRHDDVVLVAPDLGVRRVLLTRVLAGLPRARRRWIADATGRFEPYSLGFHLASSGSLLVRHLAGIALAWLLAGPILTLLAGLLLLEHRLGRRPTVWPTPRRILYLRSQLWLGLMGGGSVAHVAGVLGGLQRVGAEVHAVSSDHIHGAEASVTVVTGERWFDGALRELEELAYNRPFFRAARAVARAYRPDALYQRFEALNVVGVVLSRMLRVPLILEFNSSDVWKGRHWGGLHHVRLAELGERVNLLGADRIVVVSRVLRDDLVAQGIPAAKIVVNPNGVDPERFRPDLSGETVRAAHGIPEDRVVVGFSGTFGVWHGIPTLADAIPLVVRQRPDVRFLLMGHGNLRHLIDRVIVRERLQGMVVMTGLVPHDRMPGYLAACDVLVSPHGHQADGREFFGSPTKLYEYMASGRAIVASRVGQIGEVLRDGETALLVPPDDPRALARAIVRAVDDTALRARLGAAARLEAEERHTWARNAERALRCVTEIEPA